jgi:hypothetical protein
MDRLPIRLAIAHTCHALRTRGDDFYIFDAGILLWELVTGRAYDFGGVENATDHRDDCPAVIDDIVAIATSLDPLTRFLTKKEMVWALEQAASPLTSARSRAARRGPRSSATVSR